LHPFVELFGREIPSYGLLLVASAIAAWLLLILLTRIKKTIDSGDVTYTFLIGLCGGIIGAAALRPITRTVEVVTEWNVYKTYSAEALLHTIFTGEIVFYGGLIGGMIGILLFCKKFKIAVIPLFDLLAPPFALAHAIGRLGCLCAGCCYGVEVPRGSLLSIIYPSVSLGAPPGIPLLAVPLIESIFLFALAAVLVIVYKYTKREGLCATVYFTAYSIERFIIEFFRGDLIRGVFGSLSTSQYLSIALFVFAFVYYLYLKRRRTVKNA